MLLAAIAVCCTTFVINLHMRKDDDQIPDWVKDVTFKYLIRITCWHNGCTCRKDKIRDSSEIYEHSSNDELPVNKSRKHSSKMTAGEGTLDLTWKELSEIMDKLFYNVYMCLISISTFVMFLTIIIGHQNQTV